MAPLVAVALSIALPWIAGAGALHALTRRLPHGGLLAIGYGYLTGAIAVTVIMRLLGTAGVRWTLPAVALPVLALAIAAAWLQRGGAVRERIANARAGLRRLSPFLRGLFWVALILLVVRLIGLALEVAWRPVQPWDAWSHWGTKAKVWFEYRRMVPFVQPHDWLGRGALMAFTDQQPAYPGTVPLLQVWTNFWLGSWHDAWMNAPWPALFASLGCAAYAQARRSGCGMAESMVFAWVLLSLPFLDVHIALAGMADVFLAAAYGMCVMAMEQVVRLKTRADVGLALLMAAITASIKTEGALWLLALVPGVIVAWHRRLGLALSALGATAAVLYLAFGPSHLRLFGYSLQTEFTDVSLPLWQHMFVMDNWHLFWYAVLALVALRWRALLRPSVAPITIAMLGGVGFVVVVFFFSSAAGGVDDETLINRLLLHLVPALAFYLLLLVRAEPARPAAAMPPAAEASPG